ncbi:hypothetical protein EJB05_04985, partial [Eragrostis curvula]
LSVELAHELALGLELAGIRFLWALRKPIGVPDTDILPPGFEERTRARGLVAMGMVSQFTIMAHGAVGAFLTHCGWSSIVEGLLFGHPLIMLPVYGDQGPNARFMEGKKVGIQVPRNKNDGTFDREGVSSAVWAVMLEEETRQVFVANAKKLDWRAGMGQASCQASRPGGTERGRSHESSRIKNPPPSRRPCRIKQLAASNTSTPTSLSLLSAVKYGIQSTCRYRCATETEHPEFHCPFAMDAGSSSSSPLHVVICPWLAFGHLLPCLDLAERLASCGHRVSFVSTPCNIARLPPVRPDAAPRLEFVALPLPRVEGLPDGAESTNDVPYEKFELHRKAFDGLAAPFAEFLRAACADEGRRPDWVIVDTFHHWAAAAALEYKVPCAVLLLGAAKLIAAWASASSVHSERAASGERPAAGQELLPPEPRFESERKAKMFNNHDASGMSVVQRCSLTLERSTLVAIRSCIELETESVPLVPKLRVVPVVPLGLLPPSPDGGRGIRMNDEDATVRWLDAQPANSVVYIALGSEVPLRVEQVHEVALGLELAGTRFLWALRKPNGVLDAELLPPGFEERTHGRGLVTLGWVPQISILAHRAVGAFLTHCGWSSIIEGLLFGHPLIMLPIYGDQGPNARLMEGKKVGKQVPRDDNDGSFDRKGVASTIRHVMLEEESRKVFVANARKMQDIVGDNELHERYIDQFVKKLRSYNK